VVRAGDRVTVERRPEHEVTIGVLVTGMTPGQAQGMLDSGVAQTAAARAKARRYAERG
jgi:hypothetical protein